MSWDCIAFAENEAPELLQVREDQQDVSFIIKGQWQTRRVGTFSVTSPGKETVYLIAHGLGKVRISRSFLPKLTR